MCDSHKKSRGWPLLRPRDHHDERTVSLSGAKKSVEQFKTGSSTVRNFSGVAASTGRGGWGFMWVWRVAKVSSVPGATELQTRHFLNLLHRLIYPFLAFLPVCRKTVRPIKFNVTAITFQLRCQPCGIVRATGFSSFSRSAAGRTVLPHATTMSCVFWVVCTFAVSTKVGTVNQCRDTGQPIVMLLMFYQLYYVRCLIVLRIFKQDNASGCLDNDQVV